MVTASKIIVKVGKKSNIRFSHSKVYRAITSGELLKLAKNNNDCHIAIIESIDEDEYEEVKQFVLDFTKSEDNLLLFYVPDTNEQITSGLADELRHTTYLNASDVYNEIYNTFGYNVSIFLEDKKRNKVNDIGDMFVSFDDIEKDKEEVSKEEEKEEKDIDNRCNLQENKDKSDEERKINALVLKIKSKENDLKLSNDIIKEQREQLKDKDSKINAYIDEIQSKEKEISFKDTDIEKKDKEIADKNIELEQLKKEIDSSKDEIKSKNEEINSIKIEIEDYKTELSKKEVELAERLKDIEQLKLVSEQIKNTSLSKDTEITKLNNDIINKSLEVEQKDEQLEQSLSELKLKEHDIEVITAELGISKANLEKKEEELSNKQADLDNKVAELESLKAELEEKNQSITLLSASIENEKTSHTMLENTIKTLNNKFNLKTQEVDDLRKQVTDCTIKLSETENKLNYKEKSLNTLRDELSKYEKKVIAQAEELTVRNTALNQKGLEIQNLMDKVGELETYKELYISGNKVDKGNDNTEVLSLKAKIEELEEKLRAGSNSEITLEDSQSINRLLEENNRLKSENVDISRMLNNTKVELQNLKDKEVAIPSYNIKSINYSGRAQIVSVMGCGGTGTTTTAMSIAYKLASSCRVLYMDMDLVVPSADIWFSKPPSIQGYSNNTTSLSLVTTRGAEFFVSNIGQHVIDAAKTNGGLIHWFSGVYYRPDESNLAKVDYSVLFNALGNAYDYIIVDLGRIGNSKVNDDLIKVISDISIKSVVTTLNNIFTLSSVSNKIAQAMINRKNVHLVLNMSSNTTLIPRVREVLSTYDNNYTLLTYDTTFRETKQGFSHSSINKQKMEMCIAAIFARK